MNIKFPLKLSERAFACQLTLLNINTFSNMLIESVINTCESTRPCAQGGGYCCCVKLDSSYHVAKIAEIF